MMSTAPDTGLFKDSRYKSTTVAFRGDGKEPSNSLGRNPNGSVEEEYIENLQQQVHFMSLELKILKEKVVTEGENTGIGSMFDDEKTSHQHIQLLKEKYIKMRKDFDKKKVDLGKIKLEILGQ